MNNPIRPIPHSKLRNFIAIFILVYCFLHTMDLFVSFLVYFLYLSWSIFPVMIYEEYLKRKEITNDNQKT